MRQQTRSGVTAVVQDAPCLARTREKRKNSRRFGSYLGNPGSLVFRMQFSTWLSLDHEVVGPLVLAGVAISVLGAMMVSIDSGLIVDALAIPEPLARVLLWRV